MANEIPEDPVLGVVGLLIHVHAYRSAFALMSPTGMPCRSRTRPPRFRAKNFFVCTRSIDCARSVPCKPVRHGRCCPLFNRTRSAPRHWTRFAAQYCPWMEDVRRGIEDQVSPRPRRTRSSPSLYRAVLQGKDRHVSLPSQGELRLRAGASGLPEVGTFIADFWPGRRGEGSEE